MSFLGLANRAGKAVSGEELVLKEVRSGRAKLVLLSKDASSNTSKKVLDKCRFYNVPVHFVETRETLGKAIGKEARVTVAVCDRGFAEKLAELLDES
ncbi:putative ribosomal protein YlxQ [Weizmannia acidilactici]|nr:putative ribosomal protein YlxQ [Weizmannia acidilactici]